MRFSYDYNLKYITTLQFWLFQMDVNPAVGAGGAGGANMFNAGLDGDQVSWSVSSLRGVLGLSV